MNFLVDGRAPNLPATAFSDLFTRLSWMMEDNGSEIEKVTREWLRTGDEYKAEVALNITEVAPADSMSELVNLMNDVADRFPSLRGVAQQWSARYVD
ncbi:hypothetical protein [Hamadaea tsunoensis]|uniref:hypothetical protein n=1 Tax=Hamadaea tsunoensis TaxID=53368 RepID=UPI0012FCBC46|nr:hypothetical protein [Hamadaea tsunoensis]